MLDEIEAQVGSRVSARAQLNKVLERPLDPEEAQEYERERFGLSPEELAAQAQTDAVLADATYE